MHLGLFTALIAETLSYAESLLGWGNESGGFTSQMPVDNVAY